MKTLFQKKLLSNRKIEILESSVHFVESRFGKKDIELNIPFEKLDGHKSYHKTTNYLFLLLSIMMFIASFAQLVDKSKKAENLWIAFLASGAILLLMHWQIDKEKSWKIIFSNYYNLLIYKNSPDKETVDKFIEEIFKTRNEYLKANYFCLEKTTSFEDQLNKLKWLKNIEAISTEEFEDKYQEINDYFNPKRNPIGFVK